MIDTRPHFPGAHIYLNHKYEGSTIRKIADLSRGKHIVQIEHPKLKNPLSQEIEFSKAKETIIVQIDEYGDIYIR